MFFILTKFLTFYSSYFAVLQQNKYLGLPSGGLQNRDVWGEKLRFSPQNTWRLFHREHLGGDVLALAAPG